MTKEWERTIVRPRWRSRRKWYHRIWAMSKEMLEVVSPFLDDEMMPLLVVQTYFYAARDKMHQILSRLVWNKNDFKLVASMDTTNGNGLLVILLNACKLQYFQRNWAERRSVPSVDISNNGQNTSIYRKIEKQLRWVFIIILEEINQCFVIPVSRVLKSSWTKIVWNVITNCVLCSVDSFL